MPRKGKFALALVTAPDLIIARRLAKARAEIEAFGKYYDYCVVNEDVERAGREVESIVTALRCSSTRRRALVENLLASFGGTD